MLQTFCLYTVIGYVHTYYLCFTFITYVTNILVITYLLLVRLLSLILLTYQLYYI